MISFKKSELLYAWVTTPPYHVHRLYLISKYLDRYSTGHTANIKDRF